MRAAISGDKTPGGAKLRVDVTVKSQRWVLEVCNREELVGEASHETLGGGLRTWAAFCFLPKQMNSSR